MRTVKEIVDTIRFKIKLDRMDRAYYMFGWSCFGLFPPSFYYTHTPEEVEEITNRELEKIKQMLDEMKPTEQNN
ncbi:MAG: hypothetical protein Q4C40_01505 [Eubacteriales bacterium]|nr:hypothetical protein [Eubacteriales bacterium]